MKRYKVFTTEGFDKEKGKLTKEEERRVEKIFLQLKDNPYVGDQLRYRFLREKRIKEKRIYYLIKLFHSFNFFYAIRTIINIKE